MVCVGVTLEGKRKWKMWYLVGLGEVGIVKVRMEWWGGADRGNFLVYLNEEKAESRVFKRKWLCVECVPH